MPIDRDSIDGIAYNPTTHGGVPGPRNERRIWSERVLHGPGLGLEKAGVRDPPTGRTSYLALQLWSPSRPLPLPRLLSPAALPTRGRAALGASSGSCGEEIGRCSERPSTQTANS